MKTYLPAAVLLALVVNISDLLPAQEFDLAVAARLERLEAETQALLQQQQLLRGPAPAGSAHMTVLPASLAAEPAQGEMTMAQLREQLKDIAWTKGPFRIIPYGTLWGSMLYATDRTSPGPYTLYVFSEADQGEDSFVIDTRRTRLGMDVTGPPIPLFHNAASGGRVEIDFHGAFAVENKPGVLLRHAYGEVKNEQFRLLAGQTFDVVSPLFPGVLNYSVGWGGGNIGYRRAQVRLERYLQLTSNSTWTNQFSLNQNIVSDFSAVTGVTPESSGWPLLEGRTALTIDDFGPYRLPMTVGVSGHIGSQSFDFRFPQIAAEDYEVKTWSGNVDFRMPVTPWFGVQAELFTGDNLGTFLGGVVQGVDLIGRNAIRSSGGWMELWYDWTDTLHSHLGYGIDDPRDTDITIGRTYNSFLFGNVIFDITKKMNVGMEITNWRTEYRTTVPGDSVTFEFSGQYAF